ncbi:MAG: DNA-directed RNA polymerase subunit alpha [Candidatus Kapabacteria bacterium]|nr:DNA-directed RNA polymerase subunit alpha [Candidatus Kapabacteria bacterium]
MPERVITEDVGSQYHSKFILQPLEEGYGVTVGNALRRVILSSIPGSAIVGVKITGIVHEFQTIPGVVEDMSEIILNLKDVRLKNDDKKNTRVAFKVKGSGTWTAKSIQDSSANVEVLDPNHYIATLGSDAEFDVELRIGRGKGYIPAEEAVTTDYPVGMIPIDAIYTPIKNVIYNVEPFRVGQKTDYERLVLDVQTDGSITSQEVIEQASRILLDHVNLFVGFNFSEKSDGVVIPVTDPAEEEAKSAEFQKIRRLLLQQVDDLELSVRAHNCLKAANIKSVSELVALNEADLLKFRNFGRKSLSELTDMVQNMGLVFGMNVEKYIKELPKPVEA